MSDLYTSQTHLKRLLAGQATAAFTPAPEATLRLLDPALFPGMGALNEDERGWLQCPVRGCGKHVAFLGRHLVLSHPTVGAFGLKAALGLPKRTALISAKTRAKHPPAYRGTRRTFTKNEYQQIAARRGGRSRSAMARNESDTCPAQLQARIAALRDKIGRTPSCQDFDREYGVAVRSAAIRVFGSWNGAKATCGLEALPKFGNRAPDVSRRLCLESIRAFYEANGELPTSQDASRPHRSPRIPKYATILRAFGVDNWEAAIRSAADSLGIKQDRVRVGRWPKRGAA